MGILHNLKIQFFPPRITDRWVEKWMAPEANAHDKGF